MWGRIGFYLTLNTYNHPNKPMWEGQFHHGVQQPGPTEAVRTHLDRRRSLNSQASTICSVLSIKKTNGTVLKKGGPLTRRRWNVIGRDLNIITKIPITSQTELPTSFEKLALKNDEPMLGIGNVQVDRWASSHLIKQRSSCWDMRGGIERRSQRPKTGLQIGT